MREFKDAGRSLADRRMALALGAETGTHGAVCPKRYPPVQTKGQMIMLPRHLSHTHTMAALPTTPVVVVESGGRRLVGAGIRRVLHATTASDGQSHSPHVGQQAAAFPSANQHAGGP